MPTTVEHVPHVHRSGLAEFLRVRREALVPADVGLTAGPRRRTPGLRREEVALLAGVSVSWYTWLEQGRPVNASRQVLEALARALRLDPVETGHLLALAGHHAAPSLAESVTGLPEDLRLLIDVLEPAPAYVLGPTWQILATNRSHDRLMPWLARLPEADRNLVRVTFVRPEMRTLIADWDAEARRVLSQFRAETTAIRDTPAVTDLVARLTAASAEFARWWPRHDVAGHESRLRTYHHPVAGTLRFRHEQLVPDGRPALRVVVHLPVPGDDSAERLRHSGHPVA